MSSLRASSAQLPGFTDPPYWMRVCEATSDDTLPLSHWRIPACTSCACSGLATLPVPIAHTGSYAAGEEGGGGKRARARRGRRADGADGAVRRDNGLAAEEPPQAVCCPRTNDDLRPVRLGHLCHHRGELRGRRTKDAGGPGADRGAGIGMIRETGC